jgi:hypothetical protein
MDLGKIILHSTLLRLILWTKYARVWSARNLPVVYLLIWKKAFDTVDHSILLNKMNNYGIRGLIHDWFNSYLSDRSQTTSIGNCASEVISCSYGVPQGSVIGPLLFSFTLTIYHPLLANLNFVYLLMILVCYTLIMTFMHLSVSWMTN